MRCLLLAAAVACTASVAHAQYPQTGLGYRQTAMGALGQVGVLNNTTNGMGQRVAARNGVAAQQARGSAGGPVGKPFTGVSKGPTISPYLNLFRDESQNAAPNYYAFVRPQQEQYEAARAQQAQLQQLQRQVQQTSYRAPSTRIAGGARYGDTGRYYSGWRR